VASFNPELADAVVNCYISQQSDATANGKLSRFGERRVCTISENDITMIYNNQKSNSLQRKGENRRVWNLRELKQFVAKFASTCVVSGIPHRLLDVTVDRLVSLYSAKYCFLRNFLLGFGMRMDGIRPQMPAF
jgi:hypothetical protein